MITCEDVRAHLPAYQAGRLQPELVEAVQAHLATCRACAHEDAAEHALTQALEARLPQYPAPLALKRRLAATWPPARGAAAPTRRPRRVLAALVGAAAIVALVVLVPRVWRPTPDTRAVVAAAVDDHVRVMERRGALPISSGEIHRVRPWFTGQIDFAPVMPFGGDADFPLRGGSVEPFLGRNAAVFVFGRRLHSISLLVFPAAGLPWPEEDRARRTATLRGFNAVLWRSGDLGYALISDVDGRDLAELARRLGAD